MFNNKATCRICGKEIKGGELIYIKLNYPSHEGQTMVKKFIQNQGEIICNMF